MFVLFEKCLILKNDVGMLCNEFEEELMIYDELSGKIHVLNEVAAYIFNSIENSQTYERILESVSRKYQVEISDELQDDVQQILKNFNDENLIEVNRLQNNFKL